MKCRAKFKRWMAFLLAFTMVLSLSVTVFAEDDSKSDGENDGLESCELTEGCILPGGHEGDCELVPVTETVEEETEERTEVEKLQERINHLPSVEALESMTDEEKAVVYEELNAICDAVDALEEGAETLDRGKLDALAEAFMSGIEFQNVDENAVCQIGETGYASLKEAFEKAPESATVILLKDIIGMTGEDIATVPAGKTIVLDMAGKSITVDSGFEGRPIVNNGTLTVTGDGVIDSSA